MTSLTQRHVNDFNAGNKGDSSITRIAASFIVSGVRLISRIVMQFLSLITDHFEFTEFVNGNP